MKMRVMNLRRGSDSRAAIHVRSAWIVDPHVAIHVRQFTALQPWID